MIPSANLNEFTADQLQYAIDVFSKKAEKHEKQLMKAEKYGLPHHEEEATFKRDAALLLKVQFMNALQEVQAREKVSNN
jgi:hypothetical protein